VAETYRDDDDASRVDPERVPVPTERAPAPQGLPFEQVAGRLLEAARAVGDGPGDGPWPDAVMPRDAPPIDGYDVAGWYHPTEETGGDFFDFEDRGGGRLAIALGDVSGHGYGPGLIATACLTLLRAALLEGDDPARTVARLNRDLGPDRIEDRFVTAFYGVLDRREHRLRYVSAGQGPILFFSRARGTITELGIQGFPLGLSPHDSYGPPQDVALAPGDYLAVFTDGFFEWFNPQGECFGVERMKAQIDRDRDRPAAEMIERLYAAVLEFAAGSPQPDDLTAVVIKRVG
jgi:phosphoserine phosphatase